MNNEKEWHELRRKVMYSEDIDEEANHWKEIDRRLEIFDKIKYRCEQSINREYKVKLSTLEAKEGGL